MLVSTSFTNANLTPARHLKIGLSRKKNIKVHSPKSRYFFMCYRWKQKVSENALVERSVFHQKNNIIWQLLPFEKCFLLNFFFFEKIFCLQDNEIFYYVEISVWTVSDKTTNICTTPPTKLYKYRGHCCNIRFDMKVI